MLERKVLCVALTSKELKLEEKYLENASFEISNQLDDLGKEIKVKDEQITEFKKFLWEEKGSVDSVEMTTSLMASEMEAGFMLMKMEYYKKLLKIQYSPYFGRVDFKEDDEDEKKKIYIGLTNVTKDLENIIYDWRSPIASLFYDYPVGNAMYEAPIGNIKGYMSLRRQYKIEDKKLIRVFDNDLNVVDDCLQEVLSESSSEKMKNIVNTIQSEQNEIIRNTNNKHLIVQGIAGSGKTSVALHRIAFLLYKIKNLKSSNVLIFSPNNVFSEYISDVLPELGEENAMNTTFHDFAKKYIKEYKTVETFTDFIERFYTGKEKNKKLVSFKLSNEMIKVIEDYAKEIEDKISITGDIETKFEVIEKRYLNYLLKERYNKLPLFQRIEKIAEHLCDKTNTPQGKKRSFIKQIKELLNLEINYKKIYEKMYLSNSFEKEYGKKEIVKTNIKQINYEDSLCFIYLKGLLNGFPYSNLIKQVVVDEAQDYNLMQYIILARIFKRASFTILGDVNQTINPYQKYETLSILTNVLEENSKYVELNKTYRSSSEIIEYTNKILNLGYVSAIRKPNNVPVKFRNDISLIQNDIEDLRKKYNSVAIITKSKEEAIEHFDKLKDTIPGISIMEESNKKFNKNLVITPSYLAKGLEFDSVISYTDKNNIYTKDEKYLFYVVATRAQHELIVYNSPDTLV